MTGRRNDARMFQQGQHSLIPVLLRESVLDSVTFRATTKHFEDQLEAVDTWINAFIKQTKDFTTQLCKMEEQALTFHGKPSPTFIESGIIDADYTVTAMSRCSDASKAYWTGIFNNARSVEQTISEPLQRLQHHEMKEIRHLRNDFYKQQKAYDETLRYYYQQPKTKEASSLREDAFQLYEKRKSYIKSSFDYTIKMSTFRAALDSALISAFARSFEGTANHTSALATDFASRPAMGRIMSWSDSMLESSRSAEEYLYAVRFELEDEINRLVSPPRGLSEYTASPGKKTTSKPVPVSSNSVKPSRQGWLMMRAVAGKPARYVWHRRWCYVKDGIFGWLSNNPKTWAVEESDKIGVLLCNVKIPALEDRRFTFEVLTKDATILLQAESDADVTEWINVFDIVKRAVLAAGQSNEHAFAVTKPQGEFAAAYQALENGHGEQTVFDSGSHPMTSTKKGTIQAEGGPSHGLSALVAATGMPANLAAPRIGNLFAKIEEQKFFNPFEATVEGNDLAPSTFTAAPINTHLTKESLLESSSSVVHGPSGTQANHWGSMNYGMLNYTNKDSFEGKGASKLLTDPENAIDSVYDLRDRDLVERGLFETTKTYPADYPSELKKQDAQFCSLFPHARAEHVLMVIRATRSVPGQKAMFSGRMYVTLRGIYFYSQSSGMVLLQTCLFSEILSIRATRKVNYDEISIDIHDVGESPSLLFLDDADLVKKRIEILLANYIADKPKGSFEMLTVLQKTLPDDTKVIPRRTSRSKAISANSSDDEADQSVRKESKVDVVRLKLPSEPVLTEPDEQMIAKVYDKEYMITAKGLFHLLFGNRSPVWLQWYKHLGVVSVQQGAWQTVEDGTLARAFHYKLAYSNGSLPASIVEATDFHKISKRDEHLDYTVIAYRVPWIYPNAKTYLVNVKMNITFVSKTKSRLRMWFDIDWKSPNYIGRGVIVKAIRTEFSSAVNDFTHFLEREVLDRMGLTSKTSKAVRLYGRVEGHSDSMQLDESNTDVPVQQYVRLSLLDLILQYPTDFFMSLMEELMHLLRFLSSTIAEFVTANGLLLFLLVVSLLLNTWVSGRSSMVYWNHRAATKLLNDIQDAPFGLMSRGITLEQIDEIAYNASTGIQQPGKCFQTFQKVGDDSSTGNAYAKSFKNPRDSLARTRNDLLVAMRVLNGMEIELVKGQWSEFLNTEKRNCLMLQELGTTDPAIITTSLHDHCEDCLRI